MACGFKGSPWHMSFFERRLVYREQRDPYRCNFPIIIYSKYPLVKYRNSMAALVRRGDDPGWLIYTIVVFASNTSSYRGHVIGKCKTGFFCRGIRPPVLDHCVCIVALLFY